MITSAPQLPEINSHSPKIPKTPWGPHLPVFGTETIRSGKRAIDIWGTLELLYFVKKMSEHRYDIRESESCVNPIP